MAVDGQRIKGNKNVQIQGAVGSRIQISYGGDPARTVPLEPAHVPVAEKLRSPARLIRAHAGVVPYVERAGLMGELETWIDSSPPFSGQVIGGKGGSGKTRLAVELCQRLEASRWLCGFLSRIADEGMLDALVDAPTARLVVIDYAETRPEQLELLLPLLSAKATPESPVRVLLLVRGGADGGQDWAERLANRVDALDAVLDECEARQLEHARFGGEERRALFEAAVPALAERLDSQSGLAAPPDLTQKAFESPLMVVIAAYLAAQGEEAPATREALLDEVLAHERRYWREGAAGTDIDEVLLERLVAVATLLNADDEEQAARHLRLLSDLRDAPVILCSRLARWVRVQYPGPRWWNPLEPDLVGEHLVAKCFTEQPEVLGGVIASGDSEEVTRPLEVLARAAADHPDLAHALSPILDGELGRLCGAAVAQAEAVRDDTDLLYGRAVTVAAAVDALLSTVEVDPMVLPAALVLMPPRADLVLNGLAASLTAGDVERLRPLAADNPATHAPELAGALNNLSLRLAAAGRHPEALGASEEAVATWRPLAASSAAYASSLAGALNNLSNRLAAAGRHPEALGASEEAVAIRRPLAADNPATHALSLAGALNNLSLRLAAAGRHPEALEASEEAVATWRPLAVENPATDAPNLAIGLTNLSNRLAVAGRQPEALEAIEEAVATWRLLAADNPQAHAPELAGALNNLSLRLAAAGRHPEALGASEEAVAIRRPLAATNPAAHAANLASALNNLSLRLPAAGRQPEALEASEEAVATWRPLAATNPAAHAPNLAGGLNNLSNRLVEIGHYPEALEVIEEAVATWRSLAATNPAAHAPELAIALNTFSICLAAAGRHPEALEAIEEAVAIRRPLATTDPVAHGSDLAKSLDTLANRMTDMGRGEEAESVRREAEELLGQPADEEGGEAGA